jgi:hypothetical protein
MAATEKALAKNLERMRSLAMALPEATEEITWGTDINFRVRKKIFAFPGSGDSLTVKADREELPALLMMHASRRRPTLREVAGCAWTSPTPRRTGLRSTN